MGAKGHPPAMENCLEIGQSFRVKAIAPKEDRLTRKGAGRRQRSRSADRHGRYVRSRPAISKADMAQGLALDATLRAAAPHQLMRTLDASKGTQVSGQPRQASSRLLIQRADWQCKVRERKTGTFILFVVDASGSMGARGRMIASKGAILSLLLDAYQKRDRVALVSFRGRGAQLLLPPTASIDVANRMLKDMSVGGRTPLAAALVKAHETLRPLLQKEPKLRPIVILVSDGRANVGLDPIPAKGGGLSEVQDIARKLALNPRIRWVVVDTEDTRGLRFGHARKMADALGAEFYSIEDLHAQDLVSITRGNP